MYKAPIRASIRILAVAILAAILSGCASTAVRSCKDIAGSGWSTLSQPPANAAQLLALQGVVSAGHIVWLGKGKDKVFACRYGQSLINPGCSSSRGYVFQKKASGWVPQGVTMSTCDAEK
ncbi:MAG: hypothetical protein L0H29_01520 [Sinobacteraceae bacterium]|nr:hypothetical protein [Nevskiaceae bacterium]